MAATGRRARPGTPSRRSERGRRARSTPSASERVPHGEMPHGCRNPCSLCRLVHVTRPLERKADVDPDRAERRVEPHAGPEAVTEVPGPWCRPGSFGLRGFRLEPGMPAARTSFSRSAQTLPPSKKAPARPAPTSRDHRQRDPPLEVGQEQVVPAAGRVVGHQARPSCSRGSPVPSLSVTCGPRDPLL